MGGDKVLLPCENTRVYPSVRDKVSTNLGKGLCPKRAVFEAEREAGGMENAKNTSLLPKRSQAYVINKAKVAAKEEDPLRKLLMKQREEGSTGHPIIRRISCDIDSYTIVLFTDRMVDNIANFCCSHRAGFLSAYSLDFTFELGDYFVLVTTYKNTSLFVKKSTRSPTLLGPVLLCHKKDEHAIKVLFDVILENCRGLEHSLRVIGMDGEKAIGNMACLSFPAAVLLLCMKHAKANITEKLKEFSDLTEDEKAEIFEDIFGSSMSLGLVHAHSLSVYDERASLLLTKWKRLSPSHREFVKYFSTYKLEQFRYHVCKAVVKASEVVDCPEFYYNNMVEFINKLLKLWQGKKQIDCLKFAEQIQDLAASQESDILRAFMGLQSPFVPREEFKQFKLNFNTQYSNLETSKKEKVRNKLLNAIIDPQEYNSVRSHSAGRASISRARRNILGKCEIEEKTPDCPENITSSPNESDTSNIPSQSQATAIGDSIELPEVDDSAELPDSQVLFMLYTEARPDLSAEVIYGSILKTLALLREKHIIKASLENTFYVHSTSSEHPHVVKIQMSGKIECDTNCPRYSQIGLCSHALAVAAHTNSVEIYAAYQTRLQEPLSIIAGKNVDKNKAGKKKTRQTRKRKQQTELAIATTSGHVDCNVLPASAGLAQATDHSQLMTVSNTMLYPEPLHNGQLNCLVENQSVITLVGLCHARASVCYGCGENIRPPPASPHDLVVVTCLRRQFRDPGSGKMRFTPGPQNAYIKFHPPANNFRCLSSRISGFRPEMLQLHTQAIQYLTDDHRGMLLYHYGLVHLGPYLY